MSQAPLAVPYHIRRQAANALAVEISTAFGTYTDLQPERDVPLLDSELVVDLLYTFPLGWRVAHVLLAAPVTSLALQRWTLAAARAGIDLTFWLWGGARLDEAATWIADRAGVVYFLRQKAAGAFVPLLARRPGAPPDPVPGRDPIAHVSARFLRTAIVRYFELWARWMGCACSGRSTAARRSAAPSMSCWRR